MATTREAALLSLGRHGKVLGGNGHYYGTIIDVHSSGDYVLFDRRGRSRPAWRHRDDLSIHETADWTFRGPPAPTQE
ncbi:hypothetical protein [Variovorax gossypii]